MRQFLEKGVLLYQRGKFEDAARQFREALSQEPNDAAAKAWLSMALVGLERFEEATRLAGEAIHAAPDDGLTHYALANVLHARNRLPEALAAIREAVRLEPWDSVNFALESQIHLGLRDWEAALASANNGLESDPENISCNNLRAIALTRLGRREDASATMESVLAHNPENATSHATQGWNDLHGGRITASLEHFREAMRLDPNNEWARSGIVEAMKARNPIYGIMLRYFLWMGSLSGRNQGLIIFGGYFGNKILAELSVSHPALAPWLLPLRVAYVIFALSTWLASPLFNLLLRLDKYGRNALSREQVTASNWLAAILLLTFVGLAGCFLGGWNSVWLVWLIVFGVLSIPLTSIFRAPKGWPRTVMAGATGLLFLLGTAAIIAMWTSGPTLRSNWKAATGLLSLFGIGVFASTILANVLAFSRPRR